MGLAVTTMIRAERTPTEVLRAGMIGLDTSHVIAFTKIFNGKDAEGSLASLRVVAGYPGGTDIPSSKNRVKGFTEQLRGMGVRIYDSIPELIEDVDVVLVMSVDGRPHLDQVVPVLKAGKPLFIDKPLAGSLVDCVAIVDLAKQYDVPWFSSSSLRFTPGLVDVRKGGGTAGEVIGCSAWGPCTLEPTHPDLFWYGVHATELLFTIMGAGCEKVTRVKTDDTEFVTGVWSGGRVGTFRGLRAGSAGYGAMVFGSKEIVQAPKYAGYGGLCREIAEFFTTRKPPIAAEETLEMFAFMEAADESKRRGGATVSVAEVLSVARKKAAAKVERLTSGR